MGMRGNIDVIIGAQMGDEGKGRFANKLAGEDYAAVGRYNGGANAGHTFEHLGSEINTHQIPSGITYPNVKNFITNSSLVDPVALVEEIDVLVEAGIPVSPDNLVISSSARLVLPSHILKDEMRECGSDFQGSTKRGIAFVAGDKYLRSAVTGNDYLYNPEETQDAIIGMMPIEVSSSQEKEYIQSLRRFVMSMSVLEPYFTDTVDEINELIYNGHNILAEGAQSSGLDIEHGIHGEGTSSHVTTGGVLNSFGVGPRDIGEVFGVAKLLKSRVGGSKESFSTRIEDTELADKIRGNFGDIDAEYGKSTGRSRLVGWLDLAEIRQAQRVSGFTQLMVTKLDCVPRAGESVKVATHYVDSKGSKVMHTPTSMHRLLELNPVYEELPTWSEDIQNVRAFSDLPGEAQDLIKFISDSLDLPVTMIGVGPNKNQIIDDRI